MAKDFVGFGSLGEALCTLEKDGFQRVFIVASESGWKPF